MPLTHRLERVSFRDQWSLALDRLDLYRRAARMTTTRLHAALPCLALGTPVRFVGPRDDRTGLLEWLGLRWGEYMTMDVEWIADAYRAFLRAALGLPISERDPVRPDV